MTSIASSVFYGCSNLSSINLPSWISSINSYTFTNCSSLSSITIPNKVTTIGDLAFYGCSSLKSIIIPKKVVHIGDYAFNACRGLKSVTVYRSFPLQIKNEDFKTHNEKSGFYENTEAFLYVPLGSKTRYEESNGWMDFKEIIEIPFGDANNDGRIDLNDIDVVKKYIMKENTEDINIFNADTNGDKEINAADLVEIINKIQIAK